MYSLIFKLLSHYCNDNTRFQQIHNSRLLFRYSTQSHFRTKTPFEFLSKADTLLLCWLPRWLYGSDQSYQLNQFTSRKTLEIINSYQHIIMLFGISAYRATKILKSQDIIRFSVNISKFFLQRFLSHPYYIIHII